MKPKFSAAALKAMALEGRLSACEMRAFAARHAATLDADNHAAFVEAFLGAAGRARAARPHPGAARDVRPRHESRARLMVLAVEQQAVVHRPASATAKLAAPRRRSVPKI